jgi:hypothetical protein
VTLAAVEESNPSTYICLDGGSSNDDIGNTNKSTPKPVTRGVRSVVKHLRARGGIWSTLRGIQIYLSFTGLDYLVVLVRIFIHIQIPSSTFLGALIGKFVTKMLLATWQVALIHAVIADKSPKTRGRRMLGVHHWTRIAPAAALYNGITSAIFALPGSFSSSLGWSIGWPLAVNIINPGHHNPATTMFMSAIPALIFPLVSLLARAVFIRVAASMLPEEDIPIVRFDRLFGGKVNPEIPGGTNQLSVMNAWITFDSAALTRFIKAVLKALAIQVVLVAVGILVIFVELALLT